MKTLRRIERFITAVAVVLIGRWLYVNFDFLPIYYFAYPTDILLGIFALILLISGFCFLEIILDRRIELRKAFEVFKPVQKLTPEDFHITNYHSFYVQREADEEIQGMLKSREYVFITGIPMLGKTRMAYEAVRKLQGYYLLKPVQKEINIQTLRLPFSRRRVLLFLDDLDKYIGKFDLDALISKLRKSSSSVRVVATCRTGKEFDQVFARKEMENLLTQCQKCKIEPRRLKRNEEEELAAKLEKNLGEIAPDGTPGSITIDLRYMKERYERLGKTRLLFRSLKLLREAGILDCTETLVRRVVERIFNFDGNRHDWDSGVRAAADNGFIRSRSGRVSTTHDIYLDDKFLADYSPSDSDLTALKELLFEMAESRNLCWLGNTHHRRMRQEEALDCYQKSVKIDPLFAGAHHNLGTVLGELKKYDSAEQEYRQALSIEPDFVLAHTSLATLLAEQERYEEAQREFLEALRIDPNHVTAHGNLGNMLFALNKFDEAEKQYRSVLRISPEDALGHHNLANLLWKLKRSGEAETEYRSALRINPDYEEAHFSFGNFLSLSKRYEEAQEEYKHVLRLNPAHAAANSNLGNSLFAIGRFQGAEEAYSKAIDLDHNLPEAHFNLALLHLAVGRKPQAKREFEIARDLYRKLGRLEDMQMADILRGAL